MKKSKFTESQTNLTQLRLQNNQLTGVIAETLDSFIANIPDYRLAGNNFACPYPSALEAYFQANSETGKPAATATPTPTLPLFGLLTMAGLLGWVGARRLGRH